MIVMVTPSRTIAACSDSSRRAGARACLAAIVYMVQAGCSWRKLTAAFLGVSRPTVHRRFTE